MATRLSFVFLATAIATGAAVVVDETRLLAALTKIGASGFENGFSVDVHGDNARREMIAASTRSVTNAITSFSILSRCIADVAGCDTGRATAAAEEAASALRGHIPYREVVSSFEEFANKDDAFDLLRSAGVPEATIHNLELLATTSKSLLASLDRAFPQLRDCLSEPTACKLDEVEESIKIVVRGLELSAGHPELLDLILELVRSVEGNIREVSACLSQDPECDFGALEEELRKAFRIVNRELHVEEKLLEKLSSGIARAMELALAIKDAAPALSSCVAQPESCDLEPLNKAIKAFEKMVELSGVDFVTTAAFSEFLVELGGNIPSIAQCTRASNVGDCDLDRLDETIDSLMEVLRIAVGDDEFLAGLRGSDVSTTVHSILGLVGDIQTVDVASSQTCWKRVRSKQHNGNCRDGFKKTLAHCTQFCPPSFAHSGGLFCGRSKAVVRKKILELTLGFPIAVITSILEIDTENPIPGAIQTIGAASDAATGFVMPLCPETVTTTSCGEGLAVTFVGDEMDDEVIGSSGRGTAKAALIACNRCGIDLEARKILKKGWYCDVSRGDRSHLVRHPYPCSPDGKQYVGTLDSVEMDSKVHGISGDRMSGCSKCGHMLEKGGLLEAGWYCEKGLFWSGVFLKRNRQPCGGSKHIEGEIGSAMREKVKGLKFGENRMASCKECGAQLEAGGSLKKGWYCKTHWFDVYLQRDEDQKEAPWHPTRDDHCQWDYAKVRCRHSKYCSYQYRFGDFYLGASCRITKKNSRHLRRS